MAGLVVASMIGFNGACGAASVTIHLVAVVERLELETGGQVVATNSSKESSTIFVDRPRIHEHSNLVLHHCIWNRHTRARRWTQRDLTIPTCTRRLGNRACGMCSPSKILPNLKRRPACNPAVIPEDSLVNSPCRDGSYEFDILDIDDPVPAGYRTRIGCSRIPPSTGPSTLHRASKRAAVSGSEISIIAGF